MAWTTRLRPTTTRATASTARSVGAASSSSGTVSAARLAAMELAVELEVDGEDFGLHGPAERAVWLDLVAEFDARVAREGRWWVPAA